MEATGGSPDYLRREAPRLKRELQEQQKACTAAKAEGAKLKAALEARVIGTDRVARRPLLLLPKTQYMFTTKDWISPPSVHLTFGR